MKTRLLGGVAALVVAIIGTVLLFIYVNGADRRALADTETQDVYVVQKAIVAGTPAASISSSIAKKPVPKGVLAEGSVSDLGQIQGKVASVALEPGETLLTTRFVDAASLNGPGQVPVPQGQQEVTLRLPVERVVGGDLKAGDTVGVLLSFAKDDPAPAQTQMSFHKVLVTGVSGVGGSSAAPGASNKSDAAAPEYLVTLARTAVDAEKIVYATEFGKVYLTKEPDTAAENNAAPIERSKVFR